MAADEEEWAELGRVLRREDPNGYDRVVRVVAGLVARARSILD
jgi:hypothetical protein